MKNFNDPKNGLKTFAKLTENPKTMTENLRKELKAVFPGVKFSVRYRQSAIDIYYTDGPTEEAVKKISSRYEYDSSNSDIMTDYFEYNPTAFTQKYGGAKFVFVNRIFSDSAMTVGLAKVSKLYPDLTDEAISQRDFFDLTPKTNDINLLRYINKEANKRMWISREIICRILLDYCA